MSTDAPQFDKPTVFIQFDPEGGGIVVHLPKDKILSLGMIGYAQALLTTSITQEKMAAEEGKKRILKAEPGIMGIDMSKLKGN